VVDFVLTGDCAEASQEGEERPLVAILLDQRGQVFVTSADYDLTGLVAGEPVVTGDLALALQAVPRRWCLVGRDTKIRVDGAESLFEFFGIAGGRIVFVVFRAPGGPSIPWFGV